MKSYWFIGDIHGEIRLLDRLLENILKLEPEQIVFIGDYIDRGPYVKEVVDRILDLKVPVTCLMGNHEIMMLNAIEGFGYGSSPVELWYYNGAEATLYSFGASSFFTFRSELDSRYLDFFRRLKMSHVVRVGERLRILATHAGVSPVIPLEDHIMMVDYHALNHYMLDKHLDPGDSFLWVRDSFFNGNPELWDGYLVVHGHTPVLKLKRFIASNGSELFHFVDNDLSIRKDAQSGSIVSVDIDSGSTISGRLTGLGFFTGKGDDRDAPVFMRSLTVSGEDIFPRDLGPVHLTD